MNCHRDQFAHLAQERERKIKRKKAGGKNDGKKKNGSKRGRKTKIERVKI